MLFLWMCSEYIYNYDSRETWLLTTTFISLVLCPTWADLGDARSTKLQQKHVWNISAHGHNLCFFCRQSNHQVRMKLEPPYSQKFVLVYLQVYLKIFLLGVYGLHQIKLPLIKKLCIILLHCAMCRVKAVIFEEKVPSCARAYHIYNEINFDVSGSRWR